jgi:hypothetical protein
LTLQRIVAKSSFIWPDVTDAGAVVENFGSHLSKTSSRAWKWQGKAIFLQQSPKVICCVRNSSGKSGPSEERWVLEKRWLLGNQPLGWVSLPLRRRRRRRRSTKDVDLLVNISPPVCTASEVRFCLDFVEVQRVWWCKSSGCGWRTPSGRDSTWNT